MAGGEQPRELPSETGSGAPTGPRGCEHGGQLNKILHIKPDISSESHWT